MGGGTCVHAVRPGAGPERPGRRGRASDRGDTRPARGHGCRPGLHVERRRIHAAALVRRRGRLERHLRLRSRGHRRWRCDPGHLLPLQPGQRAVGHVSTADAGRGGEGVRRVLPGYEQHLRLRRREFEHGRGHRRHESLRHHGQHVELRREHAGPPPLDGGRLRQRERKDVPGRRLRHRRPGERPDDGVGIQPRREHLYDARADPSCRRRSRLRRHRQPLLRGRWSGRLRGDHRPRLGLQRRDEFLVGGSQHAHSDERRRQRCRQRQALDLRRRDARGTDRDDVGLRPRRWRLERGAEPERASRVDRGERRSPTRSSPPGGAATRPRSRRRKSWTPEPPPAPIRRPRSARTSTA